MRLEPRSTLFLAVGLVALVPLGLVAFDVVPLPWEDDRATVRIVGQDGTTKATVETSVADTTYERYVGLSEHDSLDPGEGMLFVHDGEAERTYVMRGMSFPIDIVFVGADGRITTIRGARAPESDEDGEDLRYSGRARWVLEVPRGYAADNGVETGDSVDIDR